MAFVLILVIILPYLNLLTFAINRRLSGWWISHKLLGSLAIVLGIIALRLLLFYAVPKLTGATTVVSDIGEFGLPFALLGLLELVVLSDIANKIIGFQPRLEILDDPFMLAMSDFILLYPIFSVASVIVGAARRRDESKETPKPG